jgi:hypothetical protein
LPSEPPDVSEEHLDGVFEKPDRLIERIARNQARDGVAASPAFEVRCLVEEPGE